MAGRPTPTGALRLPYPMTTTFKLRRRGWGFIWVERKGWMLLRGVGWVCRVVVVRVRVAVFPDR